VPESSSLHCTGLTFWGGQELRLGVTTWRLPEIGMSDP